MRSRQVGRRSRRAMPPARMLAQRIPGCHSLVRRSIKSSTGSAATLEEAWREHETAVALYRREHTVELTKIDPPLRTELGFQLTPDLVAVPGRSC